MGILIVDNERRSQRLLRASLIGEGYHTTAARTAEEGLAAAVARKPDLVLLDLDLPDDDGTNLIVRLREWSERPIIVVSARARERDKVNALDLGANDYVTKPFGTGELMARIRVALRRAASLGRNRARPVLQTGELTLDLDSRLVLVGSREVHLTPHEYDLLAYLMRHAGKVVTHPQLLKEIWGAAYVDHRAYLRVYVGQLRRKLESEPAEPRYLLTEAGVGYRLKVHR